MIEGLISGAEASPTPRTREGAITVRVFRAFQSLGPSITRHADLVGIRGGVLTLVVDDPTWLTELGFLRPEIIANMNRALPRPMITDVRLRHGRRERRAPVQRPPPVKLTRAQVETVESLGQEIRDPELRVALMKAAERALGAGKKKKK